MILFDLINTAYYSLVIISILIIKLSSILILKLQLFALRG